MSQSERPTKKQKTCKKVTFNLDEKKEVNFKIKLIDIINNFTTKENVYLFIIKPNKDSDIKFKIGLFNYENNQWKYVSGLMPPEKFQLNNLNDLNIGMKLKNFQFTECTDNDEFKILSEISDQYGETLFLKESIDETKEDIDENCSLSEEDLEAYEQNKIELQELINKLNIKIPICKLNPKCNYMLYLHANFTTTTATALKDYLKLSRKTKLTEKEQNLLKNAKKILNAQKIKNSRFNSATYITAEQTKLMTFKGYYCYSGDKKLLNS